MAGAELTDELDGRFRPRDPLRRLFLAASSNSESDVSWNPEDDPDTSLRETAASKPSSNPPPPPRGDEFPTLPLIFDGDITAEESEVDVFQGFEWERLCCFDGLEFMLPISGCDCCSFMSSQGCTFFSSPFHAPPTSIADVDGKPEKSAKLPKSALKSPKPSAKSFPNSFIEKAAVLADACGFGEVKLRCGPP
jgi:hypothetical protein